MQARLIGAAMCLSFMVPAFAQSNVTVYGRVDMGYRTFTNDGKATLEDQESGNRWGLIGEEDLGDGLSTFFQLENRFYLDTGMQDSDRQWKDKAFVGLKSKRWGSVTLGRQSSVSDLLYGGGDFEAFGGDTIGKMPNRRARSVAKWDNAFKYESPYIGGVVQAIATVGLKENAVVQKNPWGVGAKVNLGAFKADLVYQKDAVDGTKAALWKTWFVAGSYDFQVVKVMAGVARSKGYEWAGMGDKNATQTAYQMGLRVPFGANTIMATLGRIEDNASGTKTKSNHVGLGYWYSLSKRTTLMANLSYDSIDRDGAALLYGEPKGAKENSMGTELAIRHTF
ncbi:porin [Uliginosibacterium sp. sgz301328]|uniref:porin n=1 Tax=Uliginosibacterium sp. sgz301328 TaxID=3243764 RepID=UPI00359E9873